MPNIVGTILKGVAKIINNSYQSGLSFCSEIKK